MHRDIVIKWFYPNPPGEVWECLTNPALLGEWFMKNDFKPALGHKFRFIEKPKPAFKWDGIVYCEVVEFVPLKKLAYTWRSGPDENTVTMDTIVSWTLEPKENGTELILEHKGFTGAKNYLVSFMLESGWKKHVAKRFANVLQRIVNE
jgi:uncharacterized protein YndB with AHSA1/START domain